MTRSMTGRKVPRAAWSINAVMSLRRHPFDPSRLCSKVQTYRMSICSSKPAVAPQVTRRAPTFMQRSESIHVPRPVQFTTRSTPPVPVTRGFPTISHTASRMLCSA